MTRPLQQRITETRLTKTEAIVAEYFLANRSRICFMTLSEMARELPVSDASIIRCCRTLGFDGFAAMQNWLRDEMAAIIQADQSGMLDVLEKYEGSLLRTTDASEALHSLVARAQGAIGLTIGRNSEASFAAAAACIASAKKKFIVGFRSCSAPAFHFSRLLRYLAPNVLELLETDRLTFEKLLDIGEDDVVVIFCLPRYGKADLAVRNMAKDRGAKIVVITDKAVCDVAKGADALLLLEIEGISYFQSHISTIFVIEYLLALIAKQQGPDLKERIGLLSKYYSDPSSAKC
ncbi:MurR/RpiR family transcriptional regulator [Desulfovibrio sp. OttesenSCG-928-O18]|nr:MurR/RpiR family transcriptional regulator [Desulfovibrio sp. OttesenSCG-928-O18]